ncbi:helix-turn-helix domain-containing protein [Clostridium haemolyticum]|uniref:helix-turn-helix domain-containing protein n=1 Tax=Clostridium haemolyticum TaxID=84025 RepID=UPI0006905139|nr:helix-turn-helix transcriptional regulator [Clostridium haemolyticum]
MAILKKESKKSEMKTLGQKIREQRKSKGLTIRDLAQLCEVSSSFIGSIERGDNMPSMIRIKQLAHILGLSITYLLGEKEMEINEKEVLDRLKDGNDNYENFLKNHVFPNGLTYDQMCDKIKTFEQFQILLENANKKK